MTIVTIAIVISIYGREFSGWTIFHIFAVISSYNKPQFVEATKSLWSASNTTFGVRLSDVADMHHIRIRNVGLYSTNMFFRNITVHRLPRSRLLSQKLSLESTPEIRSWKISIIFPGLM